MTRPRAMIAVGSALIALAACGGDEEEADPRPAAREGTEVPNETRRPSAPSALPPAFVECMAGQGLDIRSLADMHSAPPQALQACIGSLH